MLLCAGLFVGSQAVLDDIPALGITHVVVRPRRLCSLSSLLGPVRPCSVPRFALGS